MRRAGWLLLICLAATLRADEPKDARTSENDRRYFEQQIEPLLERRCYECHSHRAKELRGGLTLDSRSGWVKGGDSGTAIAPGKPDESLLIKAVRQVSKDLQMPPKEKLPEAEIDLLVEWIRRGAVDPRESAESNVADRTWQAQLAERRQWWCFQPVRRPPVPHVNDTAWADHPIDRFLQQRQDTVGRIDNPSESTASKASNTDGLTIRPTADADRWSLARRLSFVLTGLPPAADEVEQFVADSSRDAYERLVERWLASPYLGEHWARHWMDLVKYSDTHGSEHDPLIPHAWQYRDYLVRAFNADVPYDRFVREHLAGDTLPPRWNSTLGINESSIGTAFFRFVEFYPTPIDVKNEEVAVLESQIDVFGKTFQGLTLACARCHDHKFDAISARDFAALYGIFASTRTTMHRLEDPARQHIFDQQLVELKRQVRRSLAELWHEQLEHWPGAILAARDRVLEPDPPKADKDKLMPPPFPEGTRSLEAETHRWRIALKAAIDKPVEVLHPLAQLAKAAAKNSSPAETTFDSQRWLEFTASWPNARQQRAAQFGTRFLVFADFANENSLSLGEGNGHATRPANWFAADNFQQTSSSGDFALHAAGPNVVLAIYPRGRFSHLLSNKHGGTFRSPNFNLTMKFVSVLVAGVNDARVRLVIENFPSDQLLFAQVMPKLNEPRLQWITLPIREVWAGRRAYVEVSPRDEMPYPGKLPDASKLNTDGRSGVGIRTVVFHDQGGAPELDPPLPTEFWQSEPNWPAVAKQFTSLAGAAIDAWAEVEQVSNLPVAEQVGNLLHDEQASFVDALLRVGVLLNEPPADHELSRLIAQYRELEAQIPVPTRSPGVADEAGFDERFFPRGNYRRAGAPVPRRYLEVLQQSDHAPRDEPSAVDSRSFPEKLVTVIPKARNPERDGDVGSGRVQLADAVVDPRNPLTARVMVNRLWHHVFGVGLVKSVDNFGRLGEQPSHPELLDWLASEFVTSGWSIKHMLRLMVTSRTFRLSTEASFAARQLDPTNRLLSHAHVRRLEAESLRDSLLLISGRLDRRQGGLGVPLPLPTAYKDFENPVAGPPDGQGRRSVYLEARRNYPQLFLTAFDQPKPVLTVGERNVTNVPAQSLALLNDPFVAQQAGLFAQRVRTISSPEERIATMYHAAFARTATEIETRRAIEFLKSQASVLGLSDGAWVNDAAVWNELAHALVNLKEFLFLR